MDPRTMNRRNLCKALVAIVMTCIGQLAHARVS